MCIVVLLSSNSSLLLLLLLLLYFETAAAVPSPSAISPSSCGPSPGPLSTTMPNVLVVGDAVSAPGSGYLHHLQRLLSPGLAAVQHVSAGELTTSAAAMACLGGWLGGKEWDVVVFGLGLGDCAAGDGGEFTSNLLKLVERAGCGGSVAIYATATPFASSLTSINRSCVDANNIAARAMMPTGAGQLRCPYRRIIELGSFVESYCGRDFQTCRIQNAASVLFNVSDNDPSGLQFTAIPVAEGVQRCLPVAKIACTTGARNGTAVKCTWPPPPPPPPPPPLPPAPWAPCQKSASLGCYSETKDHLQFKHEALVHSRNVTIENCASACHSLRFPVAGIDSNHCMCGTARELNPRSTRPMAECEVTNCSGDSSEKCGGNGRLLAYNFTCQHSAAASAVTQQQQGLGQPATQCGGGVDTFPLNKTIPNVLLIGDSVMFAHIGPVVKQIFDRCELAPDFCENSTEILPRGRE
jgi:hypothetical protein